MKQQHVPTLGPLTENRSVPPQPFRATDRVAVVVNGNAKQVTNDLVVVLDQIVQSGDLFVSRNLAEGREIARLIVARGYPTVLTGGGDGTFVQMVTWITHEADRAGQQPPRFGLLRLGTGNALAWMLGAENPRGRGVVADLCRLRQQGGSRLLRLLEVENTLTPFAGLGADAAALVHFHQVRSIFQRTPLLRRFATGGLAYVTSILGHTAPEYVFGGRIDIQVLNEGEEAVRLGDDGQPFGPPASKGDLLFEGACRLVSMSTIPYWGFGARVFPFAMDREDRFHLRIVNLGSLQIAYHFPSIWRGTFRDRRVHDFLVERVRIRCKTSAPFQIGGDPVGPRDEVVACLSNRPVRVVDYYSPPPVDV